MSGLRRHVKQYFMYSGRDMLSQVAAGFMNPVNSCIIRIMTGGMKDKAEVFETVLDMSYSTRIVLGKHDITLITELLPNDRNAPKLVSFASNGYEKDKVIYKVRKDFSEDIDRKDASQLQRVLDAVHREAVEAVKAGEGIRKEPAEYLNALKSELGRKQPARALAIAKEAGRMHPDDPMILTHLGYLIAMVEKKYKTAIDACEKSVNIMPRRLPAGLDTEHKPLLYFHLTRVYQAAGNRQEAVRAVYRGIGFDTDNGVLHRELERLGVRRRPVVPFLGRGHFLNRMLGRLRHRILGPLESGTLEDI